MQFSVLMSVYKKENPDWFRMTVKSVIHQTVQPDEILIVQDGKLTDALYQVCIDLKNKYPNMIHYLPLENNCGLGIALQKGVLACRNELIARMDTDDISEKNRFKLQIAEFAKQADLALCGGYIEEFENEPGQIKSVRSVPLTAKEIYSFGKKRNPFNHMTVMFRKTAILAVGNYQPFLLLEDYYLWYRLVYKGYKTKNLSKVLVTVRADNGMITRRGGFSYFCREACLYHLFLCDGYINVLEFLLVITGRFITRISPSWLRQFIYQTFLR